MVKPAGTKSPPKPKLAPNEVVEYCINFLEWGKNYLQRTLGHDAADYAGEGIFEAARTWDGRAVFLSWASVVLKRTAIAARRREHGTPGSAKHTARARTHPIIESSDWQHGQPNVEDRIIRAEWIHEALKTIDQMPTKERMAKLCGTIGLYPEKISGSIAHHAGATFDDFSHLVDAIMLCGATISDRDGSPGSPGSPRIAMKRWRNLWTLLPWIVATVEQNCPSLRFHLVSSPATVGRYITFKTRNMSILTTAARRWYPAGKCKTPADLMITAGSLAFWLADAMVKSKPDGPVILTAPGLDQTTARRLRRQMADFGLGNAVNVARRGRCGSSSAANTQHRLEAPADQRERLADWLEQTVPRCAWEPATRWQTQLLN